MIINPQEAQGPNPFIQPENQDFRPINPHETDAHGHGCMDDFDSSSTAFPREVGNVFGCDQDPLLLDDFMGNSVQNSATDGNSNVTGLQGINRQPEVVKEEKEATWSRLRWTDDMVKVFITAVAYVGENTQSPYLLVSPKKGNWRAISCAMVKRGHCISPQQCEDMFNDLDKKYMKLNEILGRGTACDVVENPSLMDSMDLCVEIVTEVHAILGCKQRFYEELRPLHNRNRKFLPGDQALQRSLRLALEGDWGCGEVGFELPSKRKRENGDGENSPNGLVASCWVQLQEEKFNIQEQKTETGEEEAQVAQTLPTIGLGVGG